ncbi:MAG: hypothetical protein Q8Q09_00690 [Deltaproteobacteria bacterium]|nr:hypothetical protein [Deltaproteobacteria bacterium]
MTHAHLSEEECIDVLWSAGSSAAIAHVSSCESCAEIVASMKRECIEAQAQLTLLEGVTPVSPALTAQVRAAVFHAQGGIAKRALAGLPAAVIAIATAALFGGHVLHGHRVTLPLVLWALAIVALRLAMTRHAASVAGTTVALSLVLSVFGDVPAGPFSVAALRSCASVELLFGAVAGVTCVLSNPTRKTASLIATCGAGALAAQAGVTVACHATGGMMHTLFAHTLGVALAMVLAVPVSRLRPLRAVGA